MFLFLLVISWSGCKKNENETLPPDGNTSDIRLERETVLLFPNMDTIRTSVFTYEDCELRYVKYYDGYGKFYMVYNYANDKLMSHWQVGYGNKFFYEYDGSLVKIVEIDQEIYDTVKTTLCYLNEYNQVTRSVTLNSNDTTDYYWRTNNLFVKHRNDSTEIAQSFIYHAFVRNPYKMMYESIKMNGYSSNNFYSTNRYTPT